MTFKKKYVIIIKKNKGLIMEQITIRVKIKKKASPIEFVVNSEKQITALIENLNDDNVFVTIGPMTINKEEIRWVEVVR